MCYKIDKHKDVVQNLLQHNKTDIVDQTFLCTLVPQWWLADAFQRGTVNKLKLACAIDYRILMTKMLLAAKTENFVLGKAIKRYTAATTTGKLRCIGTVFLLQIFAVRLHCHSFQNVGNRVLFSLDGESLNSMVGKFSNAIFSAINASFACCRTR